jgi:hypothetical protein
MTAPSASPRRLDFDTPPIERRGLAGVAQRAILRLDRHLRSGVELIDVGDPDVSFFRVLVIKADRDLTLSDGTRVRRGDPVIDVHFHNERLPQTTEHSGMAWAAQFGRRIVASYRALAIAAQTDERLKPAVAARARLAFASERNRGDTRRFGQKFGLETLDAPPPAPWSRRLHDFGEDLWLVGLTWVFNPGSLKGRSTFRRREDLWISRAQLMARHGPDRQGRR